MGWTAMARFSGMFEYPTRRALLIAGLAVGARLGISKAGAAGMTAFDFSFTSIDGSPMPLSRWRGHPLMIVNTASQCGFTPQYAGLKRLHDRYRDRGFVLIGVPSNDFGGQEPGSAAEIKTFCESRFDIDFPLTEKTTVIGPAAHPFYRWAVATLGSAARPVWNFHKFLIARDGSLAAWFPTTVEPTDPAVAAALLPLLDAPAG